MQKKRDLEAMIRGLDFIARDINNYMETPLYLPITGTVLMLIFIVLLVFSPVIEGIFSYITMIVGFTAYTIQFSSSAILVYSLNKHVEYSAYYYSQLNDLLSLLKLPHSDEQVEELMLLKMRRIGYMSIALLAGYLSLLYDTIAVVSIPLLLTFSIITGYYLYLVLDRINRHIVIEDQIDKVILSSLKSRRDYSKTPSKINSASVFVLISTSVTATLFYHTLVVNSFMNTHLSEHRYLHHRIIKPSIYKMLGGENPNP